MRFLFVKMMKPGSAVQVRWIISNQYCVLEIVLSYAFHLSWHILRVKEGSTTMNVYELSFLALHWKSVVSQCSSHRVIPFLISNPNPNSLLYVLDSQLKCTFEFWNVVRHVSHFSGRLCSSIFSQVERSEFVVKVLAGD